MASREPLSFGERPRRSPRFGLSSTVIICGLVIWTWSDFAYVRRDAETLISAAGIGTYHLGRRSLRAIDDVLESAVARIEKRGLDQIGTEAEKAHLAAFARRLPESAELLVADKYGTVIAAVPSLSTTINVRHREWFSTMKEHKAELAVGRAVRGRGLHDLIFPVARSIRGPDGTFLGAVGGNDLLCVFLPPS